MRRIGETNLWIEAMQFWIQFNTKEVYVEGIVYQMSENENNLFQTLTRIELKNPIRFVKLKDLYHVNDFVDSFKGKYILIAGIM